MVSKAGRFKVIDRNADKELFPLINELPLLFRNPDNP